MQLDRPLKMGDWVQPGKAFFTRTPWNPNKRVYGKIVDIDQKTELEHIPRPGHPPVIRVTENYTLFMVVWVLPYGDQFSREHRAEELKHVSPLIALALCADG